MGDSKVPEDTAKLISELRRSYEERRKAIEERVREFKELLTRSDEEIFGELSYCLCTPQSKARACDVAIQRLKESGNLLGGSADDIALELRGVRFAKNKAGYIVRAREMFSASGRVEMKRRLLSHESAEALRDWLVVNVKGLGYKEASHFLRNIGLGLDLAILDRHILRNLRRFGVIESLPPQISKSAYMEIERRMRNFSRSVGIPLSHLDLLLWSRETGEVFR